MHNRSNIHDDDTATATHGTCGTQGSRQSRLQICQLLRTNHRQGRACSRLGCDGLARRYRVRPMPLRAARAARRLSILIRNCHRRTMKTNPKRSPRVLIDRERHRPDRETPHPRRKGAATLQDGIRRQPKTNPELLPNQPAKIKSPRSPLRSAARLLDLFQRPSPSRPSTSTARPSPACFRVDARPSARSLMPLAMTGGSHDLKTGMGDPER